MIHSASQPFQSFFFCCVNSRLLFCLAGTEKHACSVGKTPPCEMWPSSSDRFVLVDSVRVRVCPRSTRHPTISRSQQLWASASCCLLLWKVCHICFGKLVQVLQCKFLQELDLDQLFVKLGSALCGPGSALCDHPKFNATLYCPLQNRNQHAQAVIRFFCLLNVNRNNSIQTRRVMHSSIACIFVWNITSCQTWLDYCGKMQLFLSQPSFKIIKKQDLSVQKVLWVHPI